MIDIIVVPYRDESFLTKYGPIVRDWHIILGLAEQACIDKITIVNRPTPPFLDLIRKKNGKTILKSILGDKAAKISFVSSLSFDFSWVYKKRLWTADCYKKTVEDVINDILKNNNKKVILLDFTPMSKMPYELINSKCDLYWYDMIDNFSKHNRFTARERIAVKDKYVTLANELSNYKTYITCVALGCQREINSANILPNGLVDYCIEETPISHPEYDFGFCGFVTNKFDVEFVKYLCDLGYSVVVWGDIYSTETKKYLMNAGAILKGRFTYKDFNIVFSSFKVGLVPYIKELSHDESPLKIYEYLRHGAAVLSLIEYEVINKHIYYFESGYPTKYEIKKIIENSSGEIYGDVASIIHDASWAFKVTKLIDRFMLDGVV